MLPNTLLHASMYQTIDLSPGFLRTGIEVFWDDTESNHWLYAGTNEVDVLLQGYAGYLEKKYGAIGIAIKNKRITITLETTVDTIIPPTIYLYSIYPKETDGWVKVNNANNPAFPEYKTDRTVKYHSVKSVVMNDRWLQKHGYKRLLKLNT